MGECFGSCLPCPPVPLLCPQGIAWVPRPPAICPIATSASALIPSCPRHVGTGTAGSEETPPWGDFVSLQRVSLLQGLGGGHHWGTRAVHGVPRGAQRSLGTPRVPVAHTRCPRGVWPGCGTATPTRTASPGWDPGPPRAIAGCPRCPSTWGPVRSMPLVPGTGQTQSSSVPGPLPPQPWPPQPWAVPSGCAPALS